MDMKIMVSVHNTVGRGISARIFLNLNRITNNICDIPAAGNKTFQGKSSNQKHIKIKQDLDYKFSINFIILYFI